MSDAKDKIRSLIERTNDGIDKRNIERVRLDELSQSDMLLMDALEEVLKMLSDE